MKLDGINPGFPFFFGMTLITNYTEFKVYHIGTHSKDNLKLNSNLHIRKTIDEI